MPLPSPLIAAATTITSFALVFIAAMIEPFASMNPCPMCMMQRAIYITIGVFGLLTLITYKKQLAGKLFAGLGLLSAIAGIAVAGRQVWLQHLPEDKVPACGPGLEYMMEVFPLLEVIQMSLLGTGDCAEVQWQWLGLSIPGWSIVAFTALALANILIITKRVSQS